MDHHFVNTLHNAAIPRNEHQQVISPQEVRLYVFGGALHLLLY